MLRKEITAIRKNDTETGPNFNDETKQQGTNWNLHITVCWGQTVC